MHHSIEEHMCQCTGIRRRSAPALLSYTIAAAYAMSYKHMKESTETTKPTRNSVSLLEKMAGIKCIIHSRRHDDDHVTTFHFNPNRTYLKIN